VPAVRTLADSTSTSGIVGEAIGRPPVADFLVR
jgi:hypothetical protein